MAMTQQQIYEWCAAHVAAPVLYSHCDAHDDPHGVGGYYIHRITYANGDTYEHTERGRWSDAIIETRINGELVSSRRGQC